MNVIKHIPLILFVTFSNQNAEILKQSFMFRLHEIAELIEGQKSIIQEQQNIIENLTDTLNEYRYTIDNQQNFTTQTIKVFEDHTNMLLNLTKVVNDQKDEIENIKNKSSTNYDFFLFKTNDVNK